MLSHPIPSESLTAPNRVQASSADARTVAAESVDEKVTQGPSQPELSDLKASRHLLNLPSSPVALWMRRSDQFLLGFLLISLLILLAAFRWKLSGGGQTEIEVVNQQPREFFYTIDINRASWVEWAQLDGIGEKLARRIIKDREENGPFTSVEDLSRVRGLGPKLIEKLRPFLNCADQHSDANDGPPGTFKGPR